MNYNVLRYRMTRNVLNEYATYMMFFGDTPLCAMDDMVLRRGAELEEQAADALQIIDRLRFLAKIDRSKYMPHQGNKERARRNGSTS
jgi:hypothetical protein